MMPVHHHADDPDGRIAALFAREIPEIASGVVEIRVLARNPGSRTRIGVTSNDPMVDAISVCVGDRTSRLKTISKALGERIDIIGWCGSDRSKVKLSLAPARVLSVELYPEERRAVAVVPEDQYRVAVGRNGEDLALASRLSGWDIRVLVDTTPDV